MNKQDIIRYEKYKRKQFYENLSYIVCGFGLLVMLIVMIVSVPSSGMLYNFFNFGFMTSFISAGIYTCIIRKW